MDLGRLNSGLRIAGVSAILLLAVMFLDWFGVKFSQSSSLLFFLQSAEPAKNAWEALAYIPIVLLITAAAAFVAVALRLTNSAREFSALVNSAVAVLGVVSALLILFRIVDPPTFGFLKDASGTFTREGTVQSPIFVALLAAVGIALGGCWALWEEGAHFAGLRGWRPGSKAITPSGDLPPKADART